MLVAIKVVDKNSQVYQECYEIYQREIEILNKVQGDHFLKGLDSLSTTNNLYIVTELCEGGSLE